MSKHHASLPARFHEPISVMAHVTDDQAHIEWHGSGWKFHANSTRGADGVITSYEAIGSCSEERHLPADLRERVNLVLALLPARLLEAHPIGTADREWSQDYCVADLL